MEEDESVIDPNMGPMIPTIEEPEVVAPHPFLEGVPASMPEGMGAGYFAEQSENAQMQPKEVWRQTLDQSIVNSTIEYLQTTPQAMEELLSTGTAELEPHRELLTEGIPLHLHDNVMGSMTLAGATARRDRIIEDQRTQSRLAQQVGLSRGAIQLAGGLLDADLPLMFMSGGTLAAARTAGTVARSTRALTGSTALARVAGDTAVGVSGGALSGMVVSGIGNVVRDDYDVNGLFQMVMASAVTGGVLNPAVNTVLPDRMVWSEAARIEYQNNLRRMETDLQRDIADPNSALNNHTTPVNEADAASIPVRGPAVFTEEDSFDLVTQLDRGTDESAWAYGEMQRDVNVEGIGSGRDRFIEDADLINQAMNDVGMGGATRIGEGNSKIVFGTEDRVARVYHGRPDIAVDHPAVAVIQARRQVGMQEYEGRPLQTTGVTVDVLERVRPLNEEEATEFFTSGKIADWAEEQFTGTSIVLQDYNPANFGRRPNGDLVVFDGVTATDPEDLIKDLSYQGSVGAASLGTAPRAITGDVLGLANAGAPESIVQRSLEMQNWRQDYDYDSLYAADTANPFVRTLVGGQEYKVRIPFTETDVDLGNIAGTVFTLGQRDFTNLVHSRSPSANFVAAEILESASGLVRRGSSSAVLREMYHSSAMVHSAEALVDTRNAFFRERGLNPVRVESHRQFSRDLRLAMDSYYRTGKMPEQFADVIERIDRTHTEILGHMRGLDESRSVRGARDIEHRPGYFRYDWEPQNFLRVRQQVGEANMVRAFRDGYMRGSGLDADLAERLSKAIVRRFSDRGLGVGAADGRLLDIDSRSGIEAVLEGSGLGRADIDSIMRRLEVNTQERATKGFLRRRTDVDLNTTIPGTNLRLVDLMSDDIERSIQQYVGDAAGAASLAHKGIRDNADIETLKDTMMFEQSALGEVNMSREQIDAIFSQFTGGAHKGYIMGQQTSGVSPAVSMLTKATRASLLQRVGLTQLMDSANLFVANGVANSMEPVMARLGWNKPGQMSKEQLSNLHGELESLGTIVGQDHMLFRPHLSIDETELANNVYMQMAQTTLNSVERATNYASGQIHVTAAQQMVASAAVTTNIVRTLAGQQTNLTNRMLRDIGLEPHNVSELLSHIEEGIIKVDGGKVELNTSQWTDELRLEFGASISRAVSQQVQKGFVGETSVWMNSDIGKLLSSLKTFALTAVQKQTARNLMIGGKQHFLRAATWQLGFAYAVLTLSQTMQGSNMSATDRARLAVAYTPTMGTIPMVVDPITTMLGFDDLNFSPYGRYSSFIDTPVFEQTQKLMRAPGALMDMVSGDGDYDDMQNARAMFFMNWYGMKQVWESM